MNSKTRLHLANKVKVQEFLKEKVHGIDKSVLFGYIILLKKYWLVGSFKKWKKSWIYTLHFTGNHQVAYYLFPFLSP